MSVVKSKRTQSKIEFEMTFFKVADGVDFLVENQFFVDYEQMQEHKILGSQPQDQMLSELRWNGYNHNRNKVYNKSNELE